MIQQLDLTIFRFFNQGIATPWLDPVMKFLSGNIAFVPLVILLVVGLIGWGGRRGRVFVVLVTLVLAVGESGLVAPLKRGIRRDRPFVTHSDTRLLVGRGTSFAMPSGHSAIWGAMTALTYLLYRRRWVPVAVVGFGVGISRMYLGVHYPTDVLAGWTLGLVYGAVLARMVSWLWGVVGGMWFPEWRRALPNLLNPDEGEPLPAPAHTHWETLGRCLLAALLIGHWIYVGTGVIELSEDEAYQWIWSKRLALSYYSKPLGIAVAHWLGTHVGGDTEFGVRFLPPLLSFVVGWVLLRFVSARTDGRTGFLFTLALQATPLLAVGSVLLTIDPLTVSFYTLGMLATWRAIEEDSTLWWGVVGLTLAGTLLSKYFAPFQLVAIGLALWVVPGAGRQMRRPGPYLALLILGLGMIPILVWNAQNDWITFTHLSERGGLKSPWKFRPNLFLEFFGAVTGLLNPIWLGLIAVASVGIWRSRKAPVLERFLTVFSLPIFLFYLGYTIRSRVHPNWIAAAVLPGMLAAALYCYRRWREGATWVVGWVRAGLCLGIPLVVLIHDTNLVIRIAGKPLPIPMEPLKRVRGNREFAMQVAQLRTNLLAEGKPVFVVADHYGRAGLLSFYMPGGPESLPDNPFVYEVRHDRISSQFHFWPGYQARKGENALFVRQKPDDSDQPLPVSLAEDFDRIEPLVPVKVLYRGRLFHEYEVFVCRGKR